MKKLSLILSIMMLVTVLAIPVYAAMGGGMGSGMGGGMGGGMMDNFGSGLLDWFGKWRNGNGNGYINPRPEDTDQLNQRHYEDSTYLKYQIEMKEKALDALLNSTDPDIEKARTLNRDIRALRAEADREQRNYEFESGKMNPGYQAGGRNGWGSYSPPAGGGSGGIGYGGRMRDYGRSQ